MFLTIFASVHKVPRGAAITGKLGAVKNRSNSSANHRGRSSWYIDTRGKEKFSSLLYNNPNLLWDYGEAKLMDVHFTWSTFQLMFALTFPIVSIENIQRIFSVKQTVCLKVDMPSSVVFIDGISHSFDCAHYHPLANN